MAAEAVGHLEHLVGEPEAVAEGRDLLVPRPGHQSKQFHSEIKTDLDLERLPSGKVATKAAALALMAYNLLGLCG